MGWIYDTSLAAPFIVATTEAPSYRRVALERMRAAGLNVEQIKRTNAFRSFGIRDGHGIVSFRIPERSARPASCP